MARLVTYHHAPDQVRAKAVFTQLRTALGGILYLHGGWQQLVDQLAKKAKQHHVTLLTGVKVRAIEGAYPNLLVHGKGHHIFKTRQVISTLPPVSLLKLLPKTINRRLELLRQFQPIKGASLDLALYHLPQKHTSFALGTDQPLYFSNHSRAAHLSDQGHTVIHLFKYLNGRETRNAQAIKKELEEFMDLLQPGWREKVVTSRFMPNLTVSHYLPVSDYKQWVQTLPHISEVMPGVHVCGDWTTAEHMLADAAIYSAYSAARRIIQSGETERGMAY